MKHRIHLITALAALICMPAFLAPESHFGDDERPEQRRDRGGEKEPRSGKGKGKGGGGPKIDKKRITDTVRANVYADNWFKLYINGNLVMVDFDASDWAQAVEHSEEVVGPKDPYYESDFAGAKWIWTKDLALDNTVVFRTLIERPPNGSSLPKDWPRGHVDASNLK